VAVVAKLAVAVVAAGVVVVDAAVVAKLAAGAVVVAQAVVESAGVRVVAVDHVALNVRKFDYFLGQEIRTHLLMRWRKVNVTRSEQHQCSMA
jgi:hypothetical protein